MPPVLLSPIVKLDGAKLAETFLSALQEVRIELEMQVPGRITLRFSDPGYLLSSDTTVALGKTLDVSDPSGNTTLISAEVTSIAVEQPEGQQPELVVVGHDKSHRLGRATAVNTYQEMAYSDVVTRLASQAGLTPSVDSTTLTLPYFMQVDSDLGLITEMARRVGFDWWVDGTTLNFKKPAAGTTVKLGFEDDLLSFSVKAAGHHPDKVTVDGWDRDQQQLVTSTVSEASSGISAKSTFADRATSREKAFGSATVLTFGLGAQSQPEAEKLGQAIYDRGAASGVSARGVSVGNAALALGVSVEVSGAGPLAGTYPVTAVEHLFRPAMGFKTRFRCGDRRPRSLVETLGGGPGLPLGGTAHHHPGLAVAMVTNINDPDNRGRVKVRFPGLSEQQESGWARLVAVGGGANRGNVFIPEVNDEVLVAFEGGDPRQPVVIGGLYGSKSTIPSTTLADGKVQQRAMTSRLGHSIGLLDGTSQADQAIEMKLAGGEHSVHLGKDKLTVNVPNGLPLEIVAGSSSIKFDQQGAMTLTAPKVTIKADQQISLSAATISISADSQLKLQGQAQVQVAGANIKVQADAQMAIGGAIVQIN